MAVKYKWLANRLRELIINHIEMGIGKLPSESEISLRYKVSRQTVRLSLSLLEKEGLIVKKHGSGSYLTGLTADSGGNVIGILISDNSDYIYPGLLDDIQKTLSGSGFLGQVYVTGSRTFTEREILHKLLENPPRGIIAEGCKSALPNPNPDLYQKLRKKNCPVIFLHNYYPALDKCLYVKDDNIAGTDLLVKHLINQGHTAIGGIFRFDELQGMERFQGFAEAMQEAGLPLPDERVGWFRTDELNKLMKLKDSDFLKSIVNESLSSCTAVICYNDMIAYFLIKELKLAGYRLPADMAIAAFDNTYLSNSEILTVTTLSHIPHEMGTTVAQMMIGKLKGLPVTSQEIPWKLNIKESTGVTIQ